jgi:uncharacterized protein (TIGR00297 family)
LILLVEPGNSVIIYQFLMGFILALLISVFSVRINFLTISGGIAVFLLAFLIFGFGGWKWTTPILSFFIASSLLSKFREKKNPGVNHYFDKTGSRDFYQVAANGGTGGILVVLNYFFPGSFWFPMYAGVIASACADTWGTEIGTMKERRTYDLLRFRQIEQGSSGGVSAAGLAGSLLGALFISLISVLWIDTEQIDFILLITLAGFAAGIFDSIIGAKFQAQYKCSECSRIVDGKMHCDTSALKYRGISFINNDFVNLAAGVFGGIVVFTLIRV